MLNQFNQGWFVIYTRPQHEKKIQQELTEKGLRIFLPCVKKLRTWNDRKKFVIVPLFPSYIFIYLESNLDYFTAMEAQGVLFFLRSGKELARIKDEVVNNISMLLDISDDFEVSHCHFSAGQKLMIQDGSFLGQSCEFVEYNGSLRAIVRVAIMQRNILVTLPKEYVVLPAANCVSA